VLDLRWFGSSCSGFPGFVAYYRRVSREAALLLGLADVGLCWGLLYIFIVGACAGPSLTWNDES